MTTRLRKVITAIDADGKPFSEIHRETQVNGKWYPDDPVPLSQAGPDADEWKAMFNAAVQAENDQLTSALTVANGETQAAKSERYAALREMAELMAKVEPLETQVVTIPALHEQIATLIAERDAALAQIPPPPKPREVTPQALLLRVMSAAPHAIGKIWSSESEIAGVVAATLFTWPGLIDLDSPKLKELLGGLAQAGLMTEEEIAKVIE